MSRGLRFIGVVFIAFFAVPVLARVTLTNVIVGVTGKVLTNVESRLKIQQAPLTAGKLTATKIQTLYERAPEQIQAALQPYGYFKATISSRLLRKGNAWSAIYTIKLGLPLRITSLSVIISGAAARDAEVMKLRKDILRQRGKVFHAERYNKAKEALFDLANSRGYLVAKLQTSIVKIDLKSYTCAITLHLVSGPRYRFGNPYFSKTPFSREFLGRFLNFKPGEYYSSEKLQKMRTDFDDSGLFRSALVEPDLKNLQRQQVPVKFHLTARKSQQYTLGAGYGTDTGLRGLIGVDFYNLTSTGQHFNASYKIARQLTDNLSSNTPMRQGSFEAHYIIPGRHPATDRMEINAATEYEDNDQGVKTGVAFISMVKGWQQTVQINVQRDWFTPQDKAWSTTTTLLIPGVTWLRRRGNDPVRPTKGYRVQFGIQGALPIGELSTVPFTQTQLQGKTIIPFTHGRANLLVLSGALGYTAVRSVDDLPESLLFNAGGSQSVRGYDYQELGPGTQLATASVELRRRIHGYWYGAIFYDIGNASENIFKRRDYKEGVGVGIVWLSPIGALELTYAVPTGATTTHGKIQFSMGPEL